MKLLIAYDGTLNAKNALRYGLDKLKTEGGSAVVLHLFHSAMFVDYGAGPNAESMARAESARRLAEAKRIVEEAGGGLWVRFEEGDGEPGEEILGYSEEVCFNAILAPAKYGSVAERAACPVVTFPGTVLAPVDSTGYTGDAAVRIAAEAKATGSRVVVLGVVPVHMYAASEADELKRVESGTRACVKGLAKALGAGGVETVEAMRSGYPDEEILRAMDEFRVSMVVIPSAADSPSEVSKATSMIREEEGKAGRLILGEGH